MERVSFWDMYEKIYVAVLERPSRATVQHQSLPGYRLTT